MNFENIIDQRNDPPLRMWRESDKCITKFQNISDEILEKITDPIISTEKALLM